MGNYNELKKWVSYYLNKGYSTAQVKQSLASNYSSADIDRAIKEVAGRWKSSSTRPKSGIPIKIVALIAAIACIFLVIFIGLPFLGIDLMDLLSFDQGGIETAEIDNSAFVLSNGEAESSVLRLSGSGDAQISIQGVPGWVTVDESVELTSSLQEVVVSIDIPEDAETGDYDGTIIVSAGGRDIEIPFTIKINNQPLLITVELSTDEVSIGDTIRFDAEASDKDGDQLTIFVCEDHGCAKEWCTGEGESCTATISEDEDTGEAEYYTKVCDSSRCSDFLFGYFTITSAGPSCIDNETRSCTDTNGCTGNQTCTDGEWGSCVADPCVCEDGDTQDCLDADGCIGNKTCTDGEWGSCVAEPCLCEDGNTTTCLDSNDCEGVKNCTDGEWGECIADPCECEDDDSDVCVAANGCEGIKNCTDGEWGECVTEYNHCDEDCDGEEESCKSGACTDCRSHIYITYNHDCTPCQALTYNVIEDLIGPGAPYADGNIELQLWTDEESNDFIDPYVAEYTEDRPSVDWFPIKAEWMTRGVPLASFPNPYSTWISDNSDILDATSSYVCVCSSTYECYCDELAGRQPMNNTCIDGQNPCLCDGDCLNETIDCGDGNPCEEESELMVEEVLIYFGH